MGQSVTDKQRDIESVVEERQKNLIALLKKMGTGSLDEAMGKWSYEIHLSHRSVEWYFKAAIDAGVIRKFKDGRKDNFEFVYDPFEADRKQRWIAKKKEPKLSPKFMDYVEKQKLREKMLQEVCKKCDNQDARNNSEFDCKDCSAYKSQKFEEERLLREEEADEDEREHSHY